MIHTIVAGLTTFILGKIAYNHIKWLIYKKKLDHFPEMPGFNYFSGHYATHDHYLLKNPVDYIPFRMKMADKYPKGYWESFHPATGLKPHICVFDPIATKALLNLKYNKAPKYQKVVQPLMIGMKPYSIFFCNGEMWRNHRHVLNLQFNQKLLKSYMPVVNECVSVMINKWQTAIEENDGITSKPINIHADFMSLTLDVLLRTLMSYESNCQISNDDEFCQSVIDWLSSWHNRMESKLGLSEFLYTTFTPKGRKNLKSAKFMYHTALERVLDRQELYRNDPEYQSSKDRLDLIDILVAGTQENGQPFTFDEIIMETIIFMIAGFETTANTLSWTLSHLARRRPDFQNKIMGEVDSLMEKRVLNFGQAEDEGTYLQKELEDLNFIDLAIKETLRLTPIGQKLFSRELDQEIQLSDGRVLPTNVPIHINILELHRNKNFWENPEKYLPERFDNPSKKIDVYSYLPFSAGARNCIGRYFANQEMKNTLMQIFEKFEIVADGCPEPYPIIKITLRPLDGIYVKIKSRF